MPNTHAELVSLLVQLAVFGLVLGLWVIVVILWYLIHSRRVTQLQRRLGLSSQQDNERVVRLWRDGQVAHTRVPGQMRRTVWERMEHLRDQAGWEVSLPMILIGLGGGCVFAAAVVQIVTGHFIIALGGVLLIGVVFWTFLNHCINRRRNLFERQLLDALDLAARSLRAGHPMAGAIQLVAEEIPAPVGKLFAEIQDSQTLGTPVEEALRAAAERADNGDMKVFAAAVVIQTQSGGNLADMMERVAWVIRERMRLSRRARVLTTEAQFSKRVLLALPLGLFVVFNILNPDYMEPMFTTTIGNVLLAIGTVGLLVGAWVMNRMAVLQY